jgi:hypothetical protein
MCRVLRTSGTSIYAAARGKTQPVVFQKFPQLVVDLQAGSRCYPRMDIAAIQHGTLVFERRIAGSIATVFHAQTDPVLRAEWGAPSRMSSIQGN